MNNELTISAAIAGDVPLILEFIKGLAEYEKLSHEVVANEDNLAKTLFGERPVAEVIIARLGTEAVGFALYFPNYSTFLAQPARSPERRCSRVTRQTGSRPAS